MNQGNLSAIERLSGKLDALAYESQSLALIGDEQPAARRRQSQRLSEMEDEVAGDLDEIGKRLNMPGRFEERAELSRLYVNAALLQLDLALFYIRWHAADHYYAESGSQPPLQDDVDGALTTFDQALKRRGVKHTPVTYHLLATAFRVWADKLSPEATTSSGWLEAASEVARELRYRCHRYRTRELWAQVVARSPRKIMQVKDKVVARRQPVGIRKRLRLFVHASARSLYGMVSGYGLRAGRFVTTVVGIVLLFAGIYWLVEFNVGCGDQGTLSGLGVLGSVLESLGVFTSLGSVGTGMCAADNPFVRTAAALESLAGYIMLGILVSSVWSTFHESLTDGSAIRLREPDQPPRH